MKNPLKEIGESGRALKSSLATSLMHCRPPRKPAPLIKRHLAGIRRQSTTLPWRRAADAGNVTHLTARIAPLGIARRVNRQ
jgi:hypothetical protein